MKDSFYFPHDYHARHDPKLSALIKKHGMEGYGTWWNLVEILHEQGGKIEKFPLLIEGLASELKQNEAVLRLLLSCFINDLHLLKEDETHIWSERVLGNLIEREEKRLQRVESGRLGGKISGEKRSKTKRPFKQNEANEAKERKGKERKVYIVPPSFDEVMEYCLSRKNGVDPQKWFDHYSAKGWMIGKSKMVDWQAAVRTWEKTSEVSKIKPL